MKLNTEVFSPRSRWRATRARRSGSCPRARIPGACPETCRPSPTNGSDRDHYAPPAGQRTLTTGLMVIGVWSMLECDQRETSDSADMLTSGELLARNRDL